MLPAQRLSIAHPLSLGSYGAHSCGVRRRQSHPFEHISFFGGDRLNRQGARAAPAAGFDEPPITLLASATLEAAPPESLIHLSRHQRPDAVPRAFGAPDEQRRASPRRNAPGFSRDV